MLIKVGTTASWDSMDLHRLSVGVRLSDNLFLIYTAVPLGGLKSWPKQHCVRYCSTTHISKALNPNGSQANVLIQESMCTQAIPESKYSRSLIVSQLRQKSQSGKGLAWPTVAANSALLPGCAVFSDQALQDPRSLVRWKGKPCC